MTPWRIEDRGGPIVACAIHAGHDLRPEVADLVALDEAERLREEDPYTGELTAFAPTRVVVHRSRFEVDLNRRRDKSVNLEPADVWGLQVWRKEPPAGVVERSRALHDRFYADLAGVLSRAAEGGPFVVYDLHSYNHRRDGPGAPPADPAGNPDVNLATGSMDRRRWGPVADRFMADLHAISWGGRQLDVRENVRFQGGFLAKWVHRNFPGRGCALAIDVKKVYMDEHTGVLDGTVLDGLCRALAATVPGVVDVLGSIRAGR